MRPGVANDYVAVQCPCKRFCVIIEGFEVSVVGKDYQMVDLAPIHQMTFYIQEVKTDTNTDPSICARSK